MALPRRRIWQTVAALVVMALLVAAGLAARAVLRARARLAENEAPKRSRVAPDPPRLDVRRRIPAGAPQAADSLPLATGAADDPVAVARTTAAEYRQRARYPRWSQPIAGADDPLVLERAAAPVTSTAGGEPTLVVQPAQRCFATPDPVILFAHLSRGGTRVPSQTLRGTVLDDEKRSVTELRFRDDGRDGDATADDHLYTARWTIADGLPDATASYSVIVRAVGRDFPERTVTASFDYGRPDAQLTGTYRDGIEDGDLAVDAEVAVTTAGRFHIEATLYTADGRQPLAWAQHTAELPAGTHWMRLRFYGLILRERGIDGPYLLRSVALSTMTQLPVARNRLMLDAHVTRAIPASRFTDRPFDDPDLLEAADRIEQVIEGLLPETDS